MKASIALMGVLFLTACASTVSERQLEAREYREVEWREEFLDYKRQCREKGGIIVTSGQWGRLGRQDGIPRHGDFYSCRRSLLSLR